MGVGDPDVTYVLSLTDSFRFYAPVLSCIAYSMQTIATSLASMFCYHSSNLKCSRLYIAYRVV